MAEDPFGFKVVRGGEDNWSVKLPHQCDSWEVTDWCGMTQDAATAELERFIAEAQVALRELKAGREHG